MFSVFVWRGWGILVPFIVGTVLLIERGMVNLFSSVPGEFENVPWVMPLGFFISGGITFALGWYLEQRQKRTESANPEDDYLFEPNDVFMFVRFKYWGLIWFGFAVFAYLRLLYK